MIEVVRKNRKDTLRLVMSRKMIDQASGLRELAAMQARDSVKVFTVAGGKTGVGKTSIVVNLATALAKIGNRILILDENQHHNNVSANLGVKSHYDLVHLIKREQSLDQVLVKAPDDILVLTAARGIHSLTQLSAEEQESIIKCLCELPIDVVLVDTMIGEMGHVLPFSLASQQVLITVSGSSKSITDAYTLIKIMSQEYARQDFLVIVNKVKSEPDAQSIYENIAKVAKQHLTVRLEYLGCVLFDEKLHRASQLCRSVVDAFPASTSAIEFKQLAEKLLRCSYSNQYSGGVDNFMYRLIRTSHLSKVKLSV